MDRIKKFLRRLSPKLRTAVMRTMQNIMKGNFAGLDIKPLTGKKGWYRCRMGDIRIIFVRTGAGMHVIYDIQFRDRAYRGL